MTSDSLVSFSSATAGKIWPETEFPLPQSSTSAGTKKVVVKLSKKAKKQLAKAKRARLTVKLSAKGAEVIHNFVIHNVEFDDLEEFLDNVVKYDRFRSREHITRTVKYNMLRRADGKYISKVDHRRVPLSMSEITLDDVKNITCPVLLVRGGESDILEPDAAQRFVDALPNGQLVTVPNCGHNVHSGNTPGFLDAVRPFLDAVHPVRA